MLKTIIRVQNGANKLKGDLLKAIKEKVSGKEGIATIEVILLIIIIAGILVISAVVLRASFATWMAEFDTIIDSKIDGVK